VPTKAPIPWKGRPRVLLKLIQLRGSIPVFSFIASLPSVSSLETSMPDVPGVVLEPVQRHFITQAIRSLDFPGHDSDTLRRAR
jgi:hypothetical protein